MLPSNSCQTIQIASSLVLMCTLLEIYWKFYVIVLMSYAYYPIYKLYLLNEGITSGGLDMKIASNSPIANIQKQHNAPAKSNANQNSMVDKLSEQRENLVRKKNELIAKTSEKGESLDTIQDQLKIYDQQIQNLTAQITKEMNKSAQENISTSQNNQDQNTDMNATPKTEEEVTNAKLNAVSKLGASFDTIETIRSIKTKTENQASTTESEINTDNQNRADFIEHIARTNPEAASLTSKQGASDNKYDKLAALTMRISELSNTLGAHMSDVQQEITDIQMQDKIQNALQQWTSGDTSDGTGKTATDNAEDSQVSFSNSSLVKLDAAFQKAAPAIVDFMKNVSQWNKDADENKLDNSDKKNYLNDQINNWEKDLQKKSPEEYEAWKRITSSLDVTA